MRIVNLETFRALPEGIIFAQIVVNGISPGEMEVKGETWEADFLCSSIAQIDFDDTGQLIERCDAMFDAGASFPCNKDFGRDGMFEPNQWFMIWEKDDLLYLRGVVDAAIAVAP